MADFLCLKLKVEGYNALQAICFYTEKLLEQNWPHYQRRKNEQMAEMLSKIQLCLQQLNIAYTPLDKKGFEEIINDIEQKSEIG